MARKASQITAPLAAVVAAAPTAPYTTASGREPHSCCWKRSAPWQLCGAGGEDDRFGKERYRSGDDDRERAPSLDEAVRVRLPGAADQLHDDRRSRTTEREAGDRHAKASGERQGCAEHSAVQGPQ
jgi:hypothetical protein